MKKHYSIYVLLISLLGCESSSQPTDPSAKIAANSCDADDICEIAKTLSTRKGSTSALILKSDAGHVIVDGPLSSKSLVTGSISINGKIISTSPGSTSALVLASDVDAIIVEGRLSIPKLGGEGNAYACLDKYGLLFRSDKPCK